MALDANPARLLAAYQDVLVRVEHQVGDEFEADAVFIEFAAMFSADAVDHAGGVEGAGDVAWPFLALQQPTQQDGEDLMRIDEVAVFVDRAKAIGVAIGDESRVAVVHDYRLLQGFDMRLNR